MASLLRAKPVKVYSERSDLRDNRIGAEAHMIKCPDCNSVVILSIPERGDGKCRHCYGRGWVAIPILGEKAPCPFCHGSAQCKRCGGGGRVQDPPKSTDTPKPVQPVETPPVDLSELERLWYALCERSEFIPQDEVATYTKALVAGGKTAAVHVGLSKFTQQACLDCNAEGQFKVHFLGLLRHTGCGWTGYMGPLPYIVFQFVQVIHTGIKAGGSMKDSADSKGGWMDGLFGFVFGAAFRAVSAVVLIPLHMLVGLAQKRQPQSELITRIAVLGVFAVASAVGVYRAHFQAAPASQQTSAPAAIPQRVARQVDPPTLPAPAQSAPPAAEPIPVPDKSPAELPPPPQAVANPPQDAKMPDPPTPPPQTEAQEPPQFYRIGNGVSAPTVARNVEPGYSEEARRARLEGSVIVSVVVTAQGLPEQVAVIKSLGMGLDEKAIEAIKQWRFNPGRKDGKTVPVLANIEVRFRLL